MHPSDLPLSDKDFVDLLSMARLLEYAVIDSPATMKKSLIFDSEYSVCLFCSRILMLIMVHDCLPHVEQMLK